MQENIDKEISIEKLAKGKNEILIQRIMFLLFVLFVLGFLGIVKILNIISFDRDAKQIYADLKDYQSCRVVSKEDLFKAMGSRIVTNALICELSPIQQKTPESVQLAQNKVVKISQEIENYKEATIKELSALLEDDFVKKNPEKAIDNIIAEMKNFELCLVVSSDKKMALDCSLKEKALVTSSDYVKNEVDRVKEYHQKQAKFNHQLSLINEKYFPYFTATLNKEIKIDENAKDPNVEALVQKNKALQEYESLVIEKKINKLKKEIKNTK